MFRILPLTRDVKTPAAQIPDRIVNVIFMPFMKASTGTCGPDLADTTTPPRLAESTDVATARLIACPVNRIVDSSAAATPYCLFSTELIVALVLGELKKA